jgi:porin-like protein
MLTDKATLNVQVSYDEMEDFAVVANIAYELVPNFVITPEIAYMDNFNDQIHDWYKFETDPFGDDGKDLIPENWGFFVRAQANFGG